VGLLVVASLVLITVSFRSSALDGVQGTGATILKPFEVAADRVTRPFRDTVGWFRGLADARSQNKKLRAQVADLRRQVILERTAQQENAELKRDLGYKGPPSVADFKQVATSVLANPLGPVDASVTISAGASDGITNGSIVVEPIGHNGTGALVGIVDRVFNDVSRVMLLTDDLSGVVATDLADQRVVGVVRRGSGDSDTLILDLVPKQPYVGVGDAIVTAGTEGGGPLRSRFPRGIPIGTVSSESDNDYNLYKNVQIQPYVDFSSIQSVIVLVPKANGG
jgi:rod shape-determining protein MreC